MSDEGKKKDDDDKGGAQDSGRQPLTAGEYEDKLHELREESKGRRLANSDLKVKLEEVNSQVEKMTVAFEKMKKIDEALGVGDGSKRETDEVIEAMKADNERLKAALIEDCESRINSLEGVEDETREKWIEEAKKDPFSMRKSLEMSGMIAKTAPVDDEKSKGTVRGMQHTPPKDQATISPELLSEAKKVGMTDKEIADLAQYQKKQKTVTG